MAIEPLNPLEEVSNPNLIMTDSNMSFYNAKISDFRHAWILLSDLLLLATKPPCHHDGVDLGVDLSLSCFPLNSLGVMDWF